MLTKVGIGSIEFFLALKSKFQLFYSSSCSICDRVAYNVFEL